MIDLKAARANPDQFRAALARRGAAEELDRLLEVDFEFRRLQQRIEELRAQRKSKGTPNSDEIARLTEAKRELQELEARLGPLDEEKGRLLAVIPNLPDPEAPDGWTDEDAVELRRAGVTPSLPSPKDALELGAPFGWIDVERGARLSG
ncbi:MAG: serine--tRNA ligase, partial [Actinomycetota bacterium]|nr:serine--tRNA ligase [Actinomycetota bacterium]